MQSAGQGRLECLDLISLPTSPSGTRTPFMAPGTPERESFSKSDQAMKHNLHCARYEALFESPGPQPDFHRLEKFQGLRLGDLVEGNSGSQLSAVWQNALMEEQVKQQQ